MYTDDFISYIRGVKRYSERTCSIYGEILKSFSEFLSGNGDGLQTDDRAMISGLNAGMISKYMAALHDKGL